MVRWAYHVNYPAPAALTCQLSRSKAVGGQLIQCKNIKKLCMCQSAQHLHIWPSAHCHMTLIAQINQFLNWTPTLPTLMDVLSILKDTWILIVKKEKHNQKPMPKAAPEIRTSTLLQNEKQCWWHWSVELSIHWANKFNIVNYCRIYEHQYLIFRKISLMPHFTETIQVLCSVSWAVFLPVVCTWFDSDISTTAAHTFTPLLPGAFCRLLTKHFYLLLQNKPVLPSE